MSSSRFTRYESILGGSAKLSEMTGCFSKQRIHPAGTALYEMGLIVMLGS